MNTEAAEEMLIQRVRELAPLYTPEWRFSGQCEDMGSALMLLSCGMFAETLSRMKLAEENIKVDFLNLMGAEYLPPSPAAGVVRLGVADGAETGSFVPKGSRIISDTGVAYETREDVLASPTVPTDFLLVRPDCDSIMDTAPPFRLFDEPGRELARHELYLQHDEALRVSPGGEIRVGGLPEQPELSWSYAADSGFVPFTRVRRDGEETVLTLPVGAALSADTTVMNVTGRMLRAEARALQGEVGTGGLTVSGSARGIKPDAVFAEGVEQDGEAFYPFGMRFSVYDELYVFSDEAFGKRGGQVTLNVKLSTREIPMETDRPVPEVQWKAIMKKSEYNPVTIYDITLGEVLWEYWNGRGWTRFAQGKERFFSETGEVSLTFICPNDIMSVEYGPVFGYGIRARVWSVSNAYRMYGRYLAPYCEGLRLSYQGEPCEPDWTGILHNGSSGKFKGAGCLFAPAPSPSDALFVGFDRPVTGRPIRMFCDIEYNPSPARRALVWECLGEDGNWRETDVDDETGNLTAPGLVSFPDGLDMAEAELFGRRRCWLRTRAVTPRTDGIPPRVLGLALNAVGVVQREKETWDGVNPDCAGKAGNLLAGMSFTPAVSMGFVNNIVNPAPMNGGADAETDSAALRRNITRVRHRNRAVTLADYEALAREASREILKVRAFSGLNASAAARGGCVTLVILREDYNSGGLPFEPLRRRVLAYISERCSAAACARLEVVPARLLRYTLKARLEWLSGTGDAARVCEGLQRFLHPVNGHFGGEGWEFGRLPSAGQLRNALVRASGGGRLIEFSFFCRDAYGTDPIEPYEHPFLLPVSGEHEIS